MTAADRAPQDINWEEVRARYVTQYPLLNLNNAAVSPPTLAVQAAVREAIDAIARNPDYAMWSGLDLKLPDTKAALARLIDAAPDEIALNRNATEGLSLVIFGIPLRMGDEVLIAPWDYPAAIGGWRQRARRDGIVTVECTFDLMADDDTIVAAYEAAITPRTRVMHLTHMVHWNGKRLPVERLCAIARARGILTVVDGAQSFAQMPVSFRAMACDYFVTSLHKWLGAPVGNGMVVMRADLIAETWSHLAPFETTPYAIGKFDHWNLGTYNSALQAAIPVAIEQYDMIGPHLMRRRLSELTDYWVARARRIPGFLLFSQTTGGRAGAVGLFAIEGRDARAIEEALRSEHAIHVKYRKVGEIEGLRVSPHIYTRFSELDRFVDALDAVCRSLPG